MKARYWSVCALATVGIIAAVYLLWPHGFPKSNPSLPSAAAEVVTREMDVWRNKPYPFEHRLVQYEPLGDYLNGGVSFPCKSVPERRTLDSNGIAKMIVKGKSYYHPVLSAQCGLSAYNLFIAGKGEKKPVIAYADNLISLEDDRGAFPYPFPFHYYLTKEDLPAGWVSGMAQGQALSLFARAYSITGDRRYLEAGQKALAFLSTRIEDGGVMTDLRFLNPKWSDHIIFEEYIAHPPGYTLNGFIFAILGTYDWSRLKGAENFGQSHADSLFKRSVITVETMLPYFDLDGLSAYDLGYITHHANKPHAAARYHGVHIVLLHALCSITGSEIIKYWENRWIADVQKSTT